MSKIYLQLDYSNSQMYQYSKTNKEGFEKYESSTGNVSYRKHYPKGVFGELLNVSVRDTDFGQKLQISLKNANDFLHLQFSLYDSKDNVDSQYAESIIRFLPNLKKGESYRFFPYKITAEDQKAQDAKEGKDVSGKYYDNTGMSIKTANLETEEALEKVEPAIPYTGKGAIPKLEWKMNAAGKNKPSATSLEAKNEFLLKALMEAVDGHLAYKESGATQQESDKNDLPKPSAKEAFDAPEEEDDSLPF